MRIIVAVKGGPTSGNYGHSGRPGLVGGSGGGTGGAPSGSKKKYNLGRNDLFNAASKIGQHLYGSDKSKFITGEGAPALLQTDPNDVIREYAESGMLSDIASDPDVASLYNVDLFDDFEFAFSYDPATGEAEIPNAKNEKYERENAEAFTAEDINTFYAKNSGRILVSYGLYSPPDSDANHVIKIWRPTKGFEFAPDVVKMFNDALEVAKVGESIGE